MVCMPYSLHLVEFDQTHDRSLVTLPSSLMIQTSKMSDKLIMFDILHDEAICQN